MEKAGLETNDVVFEFDNIDLLIQRYYEGKIDAIATFEPYASDIKKQVPSQVIFSSREIPRTICDVLFINTDRVCAGSIPVSIWQKSWKKTSTKLIQKNKRFYAKMDRYYRAKNLDAQFSTQGIYVTGAIENRYAFSPEGYLKQSLEEMMNFMLEEHIIPAPVSIDEIMK